MVTVMYGRDIADQMKLAFSRYAAVVLLGPRQSGKTTIARALFPDFDYLSLEDPDTLLRAKEDPRSLLSARLERSLILDEVQRAPALLSYLQGIIDDPDDS